ncbi:response regulator transcription factor [Cutibacterium sp. WCA-380-WT-3A]|uniref:Response regulator transcription factor n=1 Tax=Cutibacterium porci TaxID=2605781 RepID=A0A7K0J783_9ACTN|nr:response regulator transcription factor [Cutibacterium porci]MSS45703.1 response regulator transcription factor [Cutibacterium porci]
MSVRLVVADDHPIMRQALAGYFSRVEEMEVVGQATNGREAVDLVDELLPDVVLMDLKMPEMDGLAATRMIASRHPSVRVVALTTFARRDIVVGAILAGASGYLLKESEPEAVIAGVRAVMAGQVTVSPEVARGVVEAFSSQPSGGQSHRVDMTPVELSDADDDVLQLLAEGLPNAVIADELCLSESAVKQRLGHLAKKLGVRSRLEILVRACELGLVTPRLRR